MKKIETLLVKYHQANGIGILPQPTISLAAQKVIMANMPHQ